MGQEFLGDAGVVDALVEVSKGSGASSGKLHPLTRFALAGVMRRAEQLYSDAIEEREAPEEQARAHVAVQAELERRVLMEPGFRVCSAEAIQFIHGSFYGALTPQSRQVRLPSGPVEIVPGRIRSAPQQVRGHVPPKGEAVLEALRVFAEEFEPATLSSSERLLGVALSHHRLAFIHPFADGNGRVVRLFTQAYALKVGLGRGGLWSPSRGLWRRRAEYFDSLAAADRSREGVREWVRLFLSVCAEELHFTAELFAREALHARVRAYLQRLEDGGEVVKGAHRVVLASLDAGGLVRGEVAELLGRSASGARVALSELLAQGFLQSPSEKGALRVAVPDAAIPFYFPGLFPSAVEAGWMSAQPPMGSTVTG